MPSGLLLSRRDGVCHRVSLPEWNVLERRQPGVGVGVYPLFPWEVRVVVSGRIHVWVFGAIGGFAAVVSARCCCSLALMLLLLSVSVACAIGPVANASRCDCILSCGVSPAVRQPIALLTDTVAAKVSTKRRGCAEPGITVGSEPRRLSLPTRPIPVSVVCVPPATPVSRQVMRWICTFFATMYSSGDVDGTCFL